MNRENLFGIIKRGAINGMLFALLWGAWAYYANREYGVELAIKSSITQASFTVINAFVYSVIMESMYRVSQNATIRFTLTFIIPNVLLAFILVSVHKLRGTPEVFITVLPPLTIVSILSLIYLFVVGPRQEREAMTART